MMSMWGQWIGELGEEQGTILLNIDRRWGLQWSHFTGRAHITLAPPSDSTRSATVTVEWQSGLPMLLTFDRGVPTPPWNIGPQSRMSLAIVNVSEKGDIQAKWSTSWGSSGDVSLRKIDGFVSASAPQVVSTWAEFCERVSQRERRLRYPASDAVFRGHSDSSWPLETTFHRRGRRDLTKYCEFDLDQFHRQLAADDQPYDLEDAKDFGAMLHLGQHHGLPTPWLDWTESIYIAAYFAFADLSPDDTDGFVRIFELDKARWPMHAMGRAEIDGGQPYVVLTKPTPTRNPRAVVQKAVVMATNLARPEWFIEQDPGPYPPPLIRTDIPRSERWAALSDLRRHNITAEALFDDVGGICAGIRERYSEGLG